MFAHGLCWTGGGQDSRTSDHQTQGQPYDAGGVRARAAAAACGAGLRGALRAVRQRTEASSHSRAVSIRMNCLLKFLRS